MGHATAPEPMASRYAHYMGRVGALAVALGVGLAVGTTPGIASADDTSGESPASADSNAASNPPPAQTNRDDGTPQPSSDSSDDGSGAAEDATTTTAGHQSPTSVGGNGSPKVTIGGTTVDGSDDTDVGEGVEGTPDVEPAQSPTASTDSAPPPPAQTDASSAPETGRSPTPPPETQATVWGDSAERPTASIAADRLSIASITSAPENDPIAPLAPATVATGLTAADVSAAALTTPNTPTGPATSVIPVETLLSVPGTVVTLLLDVVGAALSPIGTGGPAENPLLLGMLAWARRQFALDFAPSGAQQVAASAVPTMLIEAPSAAEVGTPTAAATADEAEPQDFETALENLVDTFSWIPGVTDVLFGIALGVDILQFINAIAVADRVDATDEASDLAGDIAGLIFQWPLNVLMDDLFQYLAMELVDVFLPAPEPEPEPVPTT